MQNYSTSQQPTTGGSTSPTKQTTTSTDYTSPGKWTTTTTTTTSYLGSGSYLSGLPPGYTTSQTGTTYGNQTSYSSPGGLKSSISATTLGSEGKYYDTTSNPSLSSAYTSSYTSVNRPEYQGLPKTDLTSGIYADTSPSKLGSLYTSGFSTLGTQKSPESSPTTQRTSTTTYSTSLPQGKEELSQSFIRLQAANSPQGVSTLNLGRTSENAGGTPTYYPSSSIYNKQASPEMSPKYRSLQKDILDRVQKAKDTVDKTLSNSKTQSPSLRTSQQLGREFSATVEGLADSPSKRAQTEEAMKRSSAPAYHLSSVDQILAEIKSPGYGDKQQLSATNLNQRFSDVAGSNEVTTLKEENQSLRDQVTALKASQEHEGERVKRAALPSAHSEESQTRIRDLESQISGLQKEIEHQRSKSAQAEELHKSSEQKHTETTSNYSKLEAQLHQLQKENEALHGKTAEIDRLNQELNTHKTSSSELQEAKNLLNQQDLLSGIQSLIQSNNTLKGELDQHLKQHGSSSEATETRIRELEQAKTSAEEQVKKLSASLEEANSQLSHSKQGSESQVKTLEDEKSSLLQQIHLLAQESSSSTVQHSQSENIHNTELRSLFDHLLKTKSELNQLRESENAKTQEISQLTQANQTLNHEITAHKSQSTEAENSVKTVEQQKNQRIAELEAQIAQLNAERSSDHSKISELTNSIKNLENNSDENTKNLIHQVQTLTQEKNSLESQVSSLQTENKTVTQELTTIKGSSSSQEGKFTEERVNLQKQITHVEEQLQAAQKEALETKTSLQNRVAQLESEKLEVERKLYENQGTASKSQGDLNDILANLNSTKELADKAKQSYENELAQARAQIESLKQEIAQLKKAHENELSSLKETKATLEQELRKSGERETSAQAGAKADTQKLQESLKKAQDENSKLKQEIQAKESGAQKQKQTQNQDDNKKVKDLESKLAKLATEREQEQRKFTELENESRLKDKQIEGLKYDLSQMKGFIYQHHNESLFEQNEHGEEQKSDNIKFTVPSETSFTQDLLGSFIAGSEWETGSIKRSQPKPQAKAAKASRVDPNGTEIIISQAATKTQPASVKTVKTKKTKDQDPIHARYEAIIKELNEKISNFDKSRKKDAELKALEATKQYIEKEEKFAVEIEDLKQQNAALLKKIEDIEWNKAYEYTQSSKKDGAPQTQPEPVQAVPADTDAKKKKKKKKSKANEKSKDE
jgi:predicted  nucleic acid-binding Zn-ribbon protein